jgi:hypothetical protein
MPVFDTPIFSMPLFHADCCCRSIIDIDIADADIIFRWLTAPLSAIIAAGFGFRFSAFAISDDCLSILRHFDFFRHDYYIATMPCRCR